MDKIIMKGMEFFGRHGVFKEERVYGQKFRVDAILYIDLEKAGVTDDLSSTVSYSDIYEIIKQEVENEKYQLIEALAECICKKILSFDKKIEKVHVTVKKPEAPVDGFFDFFAVDLHREKHEIKDTIAIEPSGIYLSLGSNMGDREEKINKALELMSEQALIIKKSSFYETDPMDYEDQNRFLNIAVEIETALRPDDLLKFLQSIEKDMGREKMIRYGPRNIDIDILIFRDFECCTQSLTIPHPRMKERGFVLIPLKEISPLLLIQGQSLGLLINKLDRSKEVRWSEHRIEKIMKDDDFLKFMGYNENHEKGRIFCHHDMVHNMEVCRDALIMVLEESLGYSKDVVYAAGLLHDIGRWMEYENNVDHAEASAKLAEGILSRCKFSQKEIHSITGAIADHRKNENMDGLSKVLYKADKNSRLCLFCNARNQCKRTVT